VTTCANGASANCAHAHARIGATDRRDATMSDDDARRARIDANRIHNPRARPVRSSRSPRAAFDDAWNRDGARAER
jgi:hypothetical protein